MIQFTHTYMKVKSDACVILNLKKRYLSYFKFKALTHQLLHVSIFCSQVLKIFTGCKANKKCACSRYVKVTMAGIHTHTTTYLNTVFACTTKILLCICTLFCLIGERVDYYLYVTDWVMYVVVVLLKWYVVILLQSC